MEIHFTVKQVTASMRVEIDRKMTDEFPFIVPRLSADFRSGMCSLMAPNEGSNAAPYPTTSMLEEHSRYRISYSTW